jgi:hypothetical protein
MHIRISISGKRRPGKACYKQQAVLKIMVEQKTRRERERKKTQMSLTSTVQKKPETQLNEHNLANLTPIMTNVQ